MKKLLGGFVIVLGLVVFSAANVHAQTYPFTVLFPSSGATLNQGQVYKLTWSGWDTNPSGSNITSYAVYLVGGSLGSTGSRYLGTVDLNSQDWFSWTVPSDISAGSGYQIQFSGAYATGDNSESFSIAAPPVQPFSVTFPSAGATLNLGSTYSLTWAGSDTGVSSYSVYLVGGSLGSTGSKFLGTAYASQKSFSWNVPTDIASGSNYQIQFSGAGATGGNSPSFSLVNPYPFSVTYPSSGITLNQASTYKILWSGRDPGVTSYSVYLVGGSLGSSGSRYLGTVNTATQDWFSWTVPADIAAGSGYQIQFSGAGVTGDNSDSFSIAVATNPYPFAVISPSAGATLTQGSTYKILWSGWDYYNNNKVTSYAVYLVGGSLGSTGSKYLGTVNLNTQDWFSWTVSSDVAPASGYQIQFSGAGATGDNSESFSVIASSQPTPIPTPTPTPTPPVAPNKPLPADIDTENPQGACLNLQNNLRYRTRDIWTNDEVSALQDFLQANNYLNSEPTGFFGVLTLQAAKNFQQANGISPTGFVGPITRAKIKSLTCGQ